MSRRIKKAYLTRVESFCASHRLHAAQLSDEENRKIFDKCNWSHGHGHNYKLEVTLCGEVDKATGLLMNISDLKRIVQDQVLCKVDHRHLNLDVEEFKDTNPTAENIALVFWDWLEPYLPDLYKITLYETEKNIASICLD